MEAIYKMNFDYGRMGTLEGVFIAEKEKVQQLIDSQTEIYFGEVLGKHSEVSGYLTDKEIEMVTDEPSIIELFKKYELSSGYNPFHYIEEDEEEDEEA